MKTDSSSARASRRAAGANALFNVALVIFIVIALNYIGFKYYQHIDLSASHFYSLSPKTVDILKRLDSPVTATTMILRKDDPQTWDQVNELLKEYERVGGKNFTVEKVDPAYDLPRAEALADRLHFDGNSNIVIFEYKGKDRIMKLDDLYEVNPMTQQPGPFKGEQVFSTQLLSLIEGKPAKVYFLEGHGEHSAQDSQGDQGLGLAADNLKADNIETSNLNLAQKGDVPDDADAIVIAGPQIPLSAAEAQAIGRFLGRNGKLMVMLDPFKTSGLEDVLKNYGLTYDNDIVLSSGVTEEGAPVTVAQGLIYQGGFAQSPITQRFAEANEYLLIPNARSLSLPKPGSDTDSKTTFLLQTDPNAWGWINTTPNVLPTATDIASRSYNRTTDLAGPLSLAAQYDGGTMTDPTTKATVNATRIVALGSSSFLENGMVGQVSVNFFTNAVDWMVKQNAVLDIAPKKADQYGIALSPMQFRTVIWTALIIVPGIAIILGITAWLARRK
jgi:ABC-type uncharacterized transport system involved in gliding motility auxiliary subunit